MDVPEMRVQFFLNTFLCPECATAANKFRNKAKDEIAAVLAYLDTAVQDAIRSPQFSIRGALPADLPKFGAARIAVDLCMLMQKQARESCQEQHQKEPTPSTTSTSPSALGKSATEPKSLPSQSAAD